VINGEVVQRVKKERNFLHKIRGRKANWIGHILRRNCLLKHVTKGKIEGETERKRRRGIRRKNLLNGLKENRGYGKSKEEALHSFLESFRNFLELWRCRKTNCTVNE
jgi:hypothetical protein